MSGADTRTGPVSAGPAFDLLARVVQVATGGVLIALVILVCSEAFLRGALHVSLGFAEEVTGYLVVMLTFFGAALALRSGSLFQVHFLFDKLPRAARGWLLGLFALFALAICAVLAAKTGDLVQSSLARGKFAPTVLRTPLWIPQLLMPVGFAVICLFLIEQVILAARKFREEI